MRISALHLVQKLHFLTGKICRYLVVISLYKYPHYQAAVSNSQYAVSPCGKRKFSCFFNSVGGFHHAFV